MPNQLQYETSPYLLQHQHNPVNWFAWGAEALERARSQDQPILLSIGYSACHWCHVMERESFENEAIAQLMNENFVNIKVDREERPDLDQIYQNVAQALTQGGGWPLTVFLTPELRPFYGGTYFPPEDRYGRPGFPRVLTSIASAFRKDRSAVEVNALKLTEYIAAAESTPLETVGVRPSAQSLKQVVEKLLSYVDWQEGGLGGAPKFPNPMIFSFLWRYSQLAKDDSAQAAVLMTLDQMGRGGIYDQLGGGFHRYCVDASWSVPHFEKMLYDQSLLLKLYAEVLLCGSPKNADLYLDILENTIQYLFREMASPEGGLWSSQDADSEGEEGKYTVWTLAQLQDSLTSEELPVFVLFYGVSESGNFENGQTVLYQSKTIEEVAQETAQPVAHVQQLLQSARTKLLALRNQREAPGLDTKVILAWNALAVSGLLWAAQALRRHGRAEIAQKAKGAAEKIFEFLVLQMSVPNSEGVLLYSTYQKGLGKGAAFLDDYAFMAMAALDLARFSQEFSQSVRYFKLCQKWIDRILHHFKDPQGKSYFFTADDYEKLLQRPKTIFDQAIPSGAAVALECMAVLAEQDWSGMEAIYSSEVESQLGALYEAAQKNPHGFGETLCLALLYGVGPALVSGPDAHLLCGYPHVFQKFSQKEESHLLQGQVAPRYIVCHRKTCSAPLASFDSAQEAILKSYALMQ
jgi:uncharacterized protein YyaL (SSP411 family)